MELQEHVIGSESSTLQILNWETVCRLLGVESRAIESVKRDHPHNNVQAFQVSLRVWHKGSTGVPVTWEKLLEAVEGAGERQLAAEMKRKLALNAPKGKASTRMWSTRECSSLVCASQVNI